MRKILSFSYIDWTFISHEKDLGIAVKNREGEQMHIVSDVSVSTIVGRNKKRKRIGYNNLILFNCVQSEQLQFYNKTKFLKLVKCLQSVKMGKEFNTWQLL